MHRQRSPAIGYLVALACLGALLAARRLLYPWLGDHFPLLSVLAAVTLAGWFQGLLPGVVVATVGYGAATFLFPDRHGPLGSETVPSAVATLSYAALSSVLLILCVRLRRSQERVHGMLADLTVSNQQLKEAMAQQERTAATLRESERCLREVDQRRTAFIATLGHELRNPLGAIGNVLQALRLGHRGVPGLLAALDIADRQLKCLTRLVDDLLDVSRISLGKFELRRRRCNLQDVVRSALESTNHLLEARLQDLVVQLPAEPLVVDADPVRLAQAIGNLLGNSVKYSRPGTRIEVKVEAMDGGASIAVVDGGEGIEPRLLPVVFAMFTQAKRPEAGHNTGLGIGLALVKTIVEGHGGAVHAHSDGPGRGCEFRVRIPLADLEPADRTQQEGAGADAMTKA